MYAFVAYRPDLVVFQVVKREGLAADDDRLSQKDPTPAEEVEPFRNARVEDIVHRERIVGVDEIGQAAFWISDAVGRRDGDVGDVAIEVDAVGGQASEIDATALVDIGCENPRPGIVGIVYRSRGRRHRQRRAGRDKEQQNRGDCLLARYAPSHGSRRARGERPFPATYRGLAPPSPKPPRGSPRRLSPVSRP